MLGSAGYLAACPKESLPLHVGQCPWLQKEHLKWTNRWQSKPFKRKKSQLNPSLKLSIASHFTYNNDYGSSTAYKPLLLHGLALTHQPYLTLVSLDHLQQLSPHISSAPSSSSSQGNGSFCNTPAPSTLLSSNLISLHPSNLSSYSPLGNLP